MTMDPEKNNPALTSSAAAAAAQKKASEAEGNSLKASEPAGSASSLPPTLRDHNEVKSEARDVFVHSESKLGLPDESKCTEAITLKKELGLLEGVAMIVGIVIGSGIFVSPKGVIQYTGSVGLSLVVWTVSGIVSMVGALSFVELSTMIPESGGMYSYLYEAFGALPAFLYIWVTAVIRNAAGCAVVALTFSNYLLQPFFECGHIPDIAARLIAASLICMQQGPVIQTLDGAYIRRRKWNLGKSTWKRDLEMGL